MTIYRHALVIGKFYPPHRGHHWLIREAAANADRVSVVVMASRRESIPMQDRVDWLRAEHADEPTVTIVGTASDVPVDINDEQVWVAQVAVMKAGARHATAEPVDLVVTSEKYGAELAARIGADQLAIARTTDGLSASRVRHDLVAHWDDLAPPTRAGLATRIVVLGAESTGTTTMCRLLADHYAARGGVWRRTAVVDEFGRNYTEHLQALQRETAPTVNDLIWQPQDFAIIARTQTANENQAAADGSPLLICDTDALATVVWQRRYLSTPLLPVPEWASAPSLPTHHLHLLTDHAAITWVADGLREGDLEIRAQMMEWFEDVLTATGQSWVRLTGTLEHRQRLAIRAIDDLLGQRLSFSAPKSGPGFEPEVMG